MISDSIFHKLELVAKAKGRKKLDVLKPELMPYLYVAYDPDIKFRLTKSSPGQGTEIFSLTTWDILRQLNAREIRGRKAQRIVNNHTKEMTRASATLFNRIINKNLRIGMGAKSINKKYPHFISIKEVQHAKG